MVTKNKNLSIQILGLGYIGLPTSILMSSYFNNVHGVDTDENKIFEIKSLLVDENEPKLRSSLKKALNSNLKISEKPITSDVHIICVPTPIDSEKNADLEFVFDAVRNIASLLEKDNLVIIESTCPVGTTKKIHNLISSLRPDLLKKDGDKNVLKIHIGYCPERVLPGNIISELVNNNRIIGGFTKEATQAIRNIYKTYVEGELLETDANTAEFCKLAENSFRDVNIAFINELSIIADRDNININNVIELCNMHPRVNLLKPGIGVGGHCLAVDPYFLISEFPGLSLIRTAREVNIEKESFCTEKIFSFISSYNLSKIIFLGVAYKPNSSDYRESPALRIIDQVSSQLPSLKIRICDPLIEPNSESIKYDFISLEELQESDTARVLLVEHHLFREINKNSPNQSLNL